MEIFQRPGCYVWNPFPQTDETVTWTGACVGGFAQGTGTITWVVSGREDSTSTGSLSDGKMNGNWIIRWASGNVEERRYVNGEWVR